MKITVLYNTDSMATFLGYKYTDVMTEVYSVGIPFYGKLENLQTSPLLLDLCADVFRMLNDDERELDVPTSLRSMSVGDVIKFTLKIDGVEKSVAFSCRSQNWEPLDPSRLR